MQLKLHPKSKLKKAEATGDLIGKNISDKITKVSRTLPQKGLEAVNIETENRL